MTHYLNHQAILNTHSHLGVVSVNGETALDAHGVEVPVDEAVVVLEIERMTRLGVTTAIKAEAQNRIVERLGASALDDCLVRELNMLIRVSELQEIRLNGGTLTTTQQGEVDALKASTADIKVIRDRSNAVEATLATLSADEIIAFDPTDAVHWNDG